MLAALALSLALFVVDISPDNVSRLKQAWVFHTGAKAPNSRAAQIAAFEDQPVFADGLLYIITPFDQVIALDSERGTERWRFDPKLPDKDYSECSARGVVVDGSKLYFGTADARVISLDAKTGKLLWESKLISEGSDGNLQLTSPPVIVGNTVVVGSSVADGPSATMWRGVVRAFDKNTGKMCWQWDPTPQGRTGAANAWAPLAADPKRDMVFVPTGSASPDFFGGLRPGNNESANSVVALRASTGEKLWAFQVVHHDLWDYDVASQPALFDFQGKPAVGVLTKIGHFFILDRLSGKPLVPVEEKSVRSSDVEGEAASATQPFPATGSFTEQKFVPRPGWCTEQFNKLRYNGLFTPPSVQGTLVFPGNVGGANWGSGGALDPERGLLIIADNRLATAVRLMPREVFDSKGHGETGERWGTEYAPQRGAPVGMTRRTFLDSKGTPCNQPPWGMLIGLDLGTGKPRWQTPMTVSLGGPSVVNGVVFFGATVFEKKFRAFAADDGRQLWETDLPFVANSVPASYLYNGHRYVVVCAGGHGKIDEHSLGDQVIAYRID